MAALLPVGARIYDSLNVANLKGQSIVFGHLRHTGCYSTPKFCRKRLKTAIACSSLAGVRVGQGIFSIFLTSDRGSRLTWE